MFKKRFLLALEVCSIVLVSLAISSYVMTSTPLKGAEAGALSRQQLAWTGSAQFSPQYHLDCFRRTYHFGQKNSSVSASAQKDASNYFLSLS
jgi:hypothetical protein